MKILEREFVPLLFAGDINSYSMARAFYEEYQVRSIVYGKYNTGPNCNSKIVEYRVNERIEEEDEFFNIVKSVSSEFKEKNIILIGCADSYVSLASKLKDKLPSNVIAPYIDINLMENLILKENFYNMCEEYNIKYPQTFVYSKDLGENFVHGFKYPIILKPSNGVDYWDNKFDSQKKVYKIKNDKELTMVIKAIYKSGYSDKLILQEIIPGDDTNMYVLTGYCNGQSKVSLMALGNVLMEEHTPKGLGNHSVIINEVNNQIIDNVKNFLEDIKYIGFFNLDLKYDHRDNEYKFFELNTRQGRSNYYVTGAGYNLAKYVVEEYVYGKDMKYTIASNKKLWLVIPFILAIIFVKSKEYRRDILKMFIKRRVVNPVFYIKDMKFIRFLRFFKTHISHFRKMGLE